MSAAGLPLAPAHGDHFLDEEVVVGVVLKQHTHLVVPAIQVQVAEVVPIYQDSALGWVVNAANEFDERRLSGAVHSHERDLRSRGDGQRQVLQDQLVGSGISK